MLLCVWTLSQVVDHPVAPAQLDPWDSLRGRDRYLCNGIVYAWDRHDVEITPVQRNPHRRIYSPRIDSRIPERTSRVSLFSSNDSCSPRLFEVPGLVFLADSSPWMFFMGLIESTTSMLPAGPYYLAEWPIGAGVTSSLGFDLGRPVTGSAYHGRLRFRRPPSKLIR